MWKYPNVSPVLLRQCSKNSVGNPQTKVLEKCLFCNILYASKWGNNGAEGGDSSFFSVSLSIQITTKSYPSSLLNIPPAHSLPSPTATVFIQATILIAPDCYCSLLTALLLSVSPLGRSSRKKSLIDGSPHLKTLDFESYHFFFLSPSSIILLSFLSSSWTCF